MFLVTAKHVVVNYPKDRGALQVRVNPTASWPPVKEPPLPADKWFFHPSGHIDLAIADVDLEELRKQGYQSSFSTNDTITLTKDKLRSEGVENGDGVLFSVFL